ncbi:hypothetical protein BKA65DRAFT_489221 [Rhexocercosporidium sp. MPI-PUGE-AT-0058]|nr:hypothetical protein BKA65DRAFT_489221 [Rhexocercosporidium sp. MPI-PUGE-AT-0058]
MSQISTNIYTGTDFEWAIKASQSPNDQPPDYPQEPTCSLEPLPAKQDYFCKLCPKSYKSADGLRSHVKYNHGETEIVVCELCKAAFKYKKSLTRHTKRI